MILGKKWISLKEYLFNNLEITVEYDVKFYGRGNFGFRGHAKIVIGRDSFVISGYKSWKLFYQILIFPFLLFLSYFLVVIIVLIFLILFKFSFGANSLIGLSLAIWFSYLMLKLCKVHYEIEVQKGAITSAEIVGDKISISADVNSESGQLNFEVYHTITLYDDILNELTLSGDEFESIQYHCPQCRKTIVPREEICLECSNAVPKPERETQTIM